jgi:hypothetical protein
MVVDSLRKAARFYDEDSMQVTGHQRELVAKYAAEHRALADQIESAEYVKVGPEKTLNTNPSFQL